MNINLSFAWYDLWIGAYIDNEHHRVFICPLPCVLITIEWGKSEIDEFIERIEPSVQEMARKIRERKL